jgi:hypothetical protein
VQLSSGGWRDWHSAQKARAIMPGERAQWFEGSDDDRRWVYGFKTAEQAAAFKAWSESCGIDWSVPVSEQPPETRPPKSPRARCGRRSIGSSGLAALRRAGGGVQGHSRSRYPIFAGGISSDYSRSLVIRSILIQCLARPAVYRIKLPPG